MRCGGMRPAAGGERSSRVQRARNQSPCIVLDSRRMRKVPDAAIERELRRCAKTIKGIRRLLFVGRHGSVTTIL